MKKLLLLVSCLILPLVAKNARAQGFFPQSISFSSPPNQTYGAAPFNIGSYATASSGLPITFIVNSGPVTVNNLAVGNPVTIDGAGTVSITAFQLGNPTFAPAPPVTQVFTVYPLPLVLGGSRPYDGTATAASAILTISNVVGGDDVNLASGSATLASASVGLEAIADPSGLALGGVTASNYTLVGASGSVNITNPFNPFSIVSSSLDATRTNVVVCWDSVPGVVYSVLTNGTLTRPQAWAASGDPITATNTTTCYTLPGGLGGANVFVIIKQQ